MIFEMKWGAWSGYTMVSSKEENTGRRLMGVFPVVPIAIAIIRGMRR